MRLSRHPSWNVKSRMETGVPDWYTDLLSGLVNTRDIHSSNILKEMAMCHDEIITDHAVPSNDIGELMDEA